MGRTILTYGAIAGLIVGTPLFAMMVIGGGQTLIEGGMLLGYTIMLVALSLVFLAIKRQRDAEGGGVIRFWPALKVGLGVSFIAAICYVVAWEAALAATEADFIGLYTESLIADERAKGAGPAAIAKLRADMAVMAQSYANPLYRIPLTMTEILPVGILVSLVSAALLRNPGFMPAHRVAAS